MKREVKLFLALIGLESCPIAETLDAYRNGKLNKKESKEIEEHLKVCPSCREKMKLFEKFPYPTEETEKEIEKLKKLGRRKTFPADLEIFFPPLSRNISY